MPFSLFPTLVILFLSFFSTTAHSEQFVQAPLSVEVKEEHSLRPIDDRMGKTSQSLIVRDGVEWIFVKESGVPDVGPLYKREGVDTTPLLFSPKLDRMVNPECPLESMDGTIRNQIGYGCVFTEIEHKENLEKDRQAVDKNPFDLNPPRQKGEAQVKEIVFGSPERESKFNSCIFTLKKTSKFIENNRSNLKPDMANGLSGWLAMFDVGLVRDDVSSLEVDELNPEDLNVCLDFNADLKSIRLLQMAITDELPSSPEEALLSCGVGLMTLTWAYEELYGHQAGFEAGKKMGEELGSTAAIISHLYKGYDDLASQEKMNLFFSDVNSGVKTYREEKAINKPILLNAHLHDCESLNISVAPYIKMLPASMRPDYKYVDEFVSEDFSLFADVVDIFDFGFFLFFYLVVGGCRIGKIYSEDPINSPAWPYPKSWWKEVLIAVLWPIEVLVNFWANGCYSKSAAIEVVKEEAKFVFIIGMVFGVAVLAYFIAGQITHIVLIKIFISFPLVFLIRKSLSKIFPITGR